MWFCLTIKPASTKQDQFHTCLHLQFNDPFIPLFMCLLVPTGFSKEPAHYSGVIKDIVHFEEHTEAEQK